MNPKRRRRGTWVSVVVLAALAISLASIPAASGDPIGSPPAGLITVTETGGISTYTADVVDPDGNIQSVWWYSQSYKGCEGWTNPSAYVFIWNHTGCPHPPEVHSVHVSVVIADSAGWQAVCTYDGSQPGSGPACQTRSNIAECPGFAGDPRPQIVGTPGDDLLEGTQGPDVICGLDGGDTIHALAGDDEVFAGPGNDLVHGFEGEDTIWGQGGRDALGANEGNDDVEGGSGPDVMWGDEGKDLMVGGPGNDDLLGLMEADRLYGSAGNDYINGGTARDFCSGGGGSDRIQRCDP